MVEAKLVQKSWDSRNLGAREVKTRPVWFAEGRAEQVGTRSQRRALSPEAWNRLTTGAPVMLC